MAIKGAASGTSISCGSSQRVVTPHATDDLPIKPARSLFVGGAGTISFVAVGDTEPVQWTVPAGFVITMRVKAVRVSGTSATNIVAIY